MATEAEQLEHAKASMKLLFLHIKYLNNSVDLLLEGIRELGKHDAETANVIMSVLLAMQEIHKKELGIPDDWDINEVMDIPITKEQ